MLERRDLERLYKPGGEFYSDSGSEDRDSDITNNVQNVSETVSWWFYSDQKRLTAADFPFGLTVGKTSLMMISISIFGPLLVIGISWLIVKIAKKKLRQTHNVRNSITPAESAQARKSILKGSHSRKHSRESVYRITRKGSADPISSRTWLSKSSTTTSPAPHQKEDQSGSMPELLPLNRKVYSHYEFMEYFDLSDEDEKTNISNGMQLGVISPENLTAHLESQLLAGQACENGTFHTVC